MSGAIDILRVSRLSCEWKRGTGPFRDLQQDTCGGMMSEEARVREKVADHERVPFLISYHRLLTPYQHMVCELIQHLISLTDPILSAFQQTPDMAPFSGWIAVSLQRRLGSV
jgi:hypothetical protein